MPRSRSPRSRSRSRRRSRSHGHRSRSHSRDRSRDHYRRRRSSRSYSRERDRRNRSPDRRTDNHWRRDKHSPSPKQSRTQPEHQPRFATDIPADQLFSTLLPPAPEFSSSTNSREDESLFPSSSSTAKKLLSQSSIEQLAKKKASEDNSQAIKPVFLTKKQREELALKKLEEEQKQAQTERQRLEQSWNNFTNNGTTTALKAEERRKDEKREREEQERRRREREREQQQQRSKEQEHQQQQDKELELIKQTYLGKKDTKKKIVLPSQRMKFEFDWKAVDDTSSDFNPLYSQRANIALGFGRSFLGGVDRRDQRKKQTFYDQLVNSRSEGKEAVVVPTSDHNDDDYARYKQERVAKKEKDAILLGRHWSEKPLQEMTERDWRIFKEDFQINMRGPRAPLPIRSWEEANLPKSILDSLQRLSYKQPSPIQRAAIPVGLKNIDLVGIAETGSGKTIAFLLPMLVYISNLPPITPDMAGDGPYAVVLAPTRELAQQISEECDKFGKSMHIRNVPIVGGISIEEQGFALRDGAEILIATPGRLFDCIERRYLVLNRCTYIVLDEADRMIDMNFEPQLVKILDSMPASNLRPENPDDEKADQRYRQTIMFSATMPIKVELLAKKYLRHPVFISIGDRRGKANANVEQRVEWLTSEAQKRNRLQEILAESEPPFIIFCNTKRGCDSLSKFIDSLGYGYTVIHGDKSQEARQSALDFFKRSEVPILIATDVVGRGIDISDVQQVINFEMPTEIEKYMHRIGRTGRAGKQGIATSFLSEQDTAIFFDLKEVLREANQIIPSELANHPAAREKSGVPGQKPGFNKTPRFL